MAGHLAAVIVSDQHRHLGDTPQVHYHDTICHVLDHHHVVSWLIRG
jgi:hypothetical protein